jgi:ABC-type lipoprotein export system ATPase subunit
MHGESNKKWGKGLQGAGEFIRVVDASKVYQTQDGGEVEAFTNFNLEIEEDEFLVLVGPSGCGKSTLLNTHDEFAIVGEGRSRAQQSDAVSLDRRL